MHELTIAEAIREALLEEMSRDDSIVVLGQDVRVGYVSGATKGLVERFGPERVIDTPISEEGMVGAAVGAAMTGLKPVVEVLVNDFLMLAGDPIVNHAAKAHYIFAEQLSVPLVVRTGYGSRGGFGAHHSQSLYSWYAHVPGLKVVMPSTPADAKGLMKSALRDGNPILFFEHMAMYRTKGNVPDGEHLIPIGSAEVRRTGKQLTIVATGRMVSRSLDAAERLLSEGIDAEVIDVRTLKPLDKKTILDSVRKTNRAVVADEGCKTGGFSAEVGMIIEEEAFNSLDAPVERVGAKDAPLPFDPLLESAILPSTEDVINAARKVCGVKP